MKKAVMMKILYIPLLLACLLPAGARWMRPCADMEKTARGDVYIDGGTQYLHAYEILPRSPDPSPAATDPDAGPSVTPAPDFVATPTPEPSPTPSPTPSAVPSPTAVPTPIPTPEPIPTLSEIVTSAMTPETLERSSLAYKILTQPRIKLARIHPSGVQDHAFAYDNIYYAYLGYPAERSHYQNAPGGETVLGVNMLTVILRLSEKYTFTITEIAGASHSKTSRHYDGIAFDVGIINGRYATYNSISRAFVADASAFGATNTLIESTCVHIECE